MTLTSRSWGNRLRSGTPGEATRIVVIATICATRPLGAVRGVRVSPLPSARNGQRRCRTQTTPAAHPVGAADRGPQSPVFGRVRRSPPSRKAALTILSEGHQTVDRWRETDHEFALNYLKVERDKARGKKTGKTIPFDPFRDLPAVPGLVEFRRRVFGFPSTPTQTAFAQAWDDKTNLYIFWEAPAGAGKDVAAMQAVAQAAAGGLEKMGCVMENEKQAKKRIDSYLDPYFTDHSVYTRAPNIPRRCEPGD